MTDLPVDDEALDWALRMAEPDADWDAFMAWLEGDASRAGRYDRAAVALGDAADLIAAAPPPTPAPPMPAPSMPTPIRSTRAPGRNRPSVRRWTTGAVAAALAGAIGLGVWTELPRPYAIETRDGEQRTVRLGDGSSVVLAGGSTVLLDRADARTASLERGEALFRVRHDAAHPFTVGVGDLHLVDLGTVFDVKATGARTIVGVGEGAVMVEPRGARLRLDPGQGLIARGSSLQRTSIDPATVGGWRDGLLSYDDAPLDEVAADLSRQLGRRITVDPAVAARTFRGTLDVGTFGDRPALLGRLLGVAVREDTGGWSLEPAP